MADATATTLPNYPAATNLDGSELIPIWQNNKQCSATANQLLKPGLDEMGNYIAEAQLIANQIVDGATAVAASVGFLNAAVSTGKMPPYTVTGIAAGSAGSGSTVAGEFDLVISGGPAGHKARVIVSGGAITGYRISNGGLSTSNAAPTYTLPTIAGLTGATAPTATVSALANGQSFEALSGDSQRALLWQVSAGVLAPVNDASGAQVSRYLKVGVDSAVATAVSSAARTTQEAADRNVAERARLLYNPPAWKLDRLLSLCGNSISANTGSISQTKDVINAVIDPASPYFCGTHYFVGTGTSMLQALDYLTANWTTVDKAGDLVLVDPMVGEGNNYLNFAVLDDAFTRLEAIKAMQTGSGQTLLLMVSDPPDDWNLNITASYRMWKERLQAKPYSADCPDVRQHIIDWYSVPTGFGRDRMEWNELPLGYASASTSSPTTKVNVPARRQSCR
jgi:hypothetical protein